MKNLKVVVAGVLVAGSAFTLSACGSSTHEPSAKEKAAAWWTSVSPDVDQFQNHLMALSDVTGMSSYDDLTGLCTDLLTDVDNLQAKDSFPKDPVTWDSSLNNFDKAFSSCIDQDYGDMLSSMNKANTDLEKVVNEVTALHLNK